MGEIRLVMELSLNSDREEEEVVCDFRGFVELRKTDCGKQQHLYGLSDNLGKPIFYYQTKEFVVHF